MKAQNADGQTAEEGRRAKGEREEVARNRERSEEKEGRAGLCASACFLFCFAVPFGLKNKMKSRWDLRHSSGGKKFILVLLEDTAVPQTRNKYFCPNEIDGGG